MFRCVPLSLFLSHLNQFHFCSLSFCFAVTSLVGPACGLFFGLTITHRLVHSPGFEYSFGPHLSNLRVRLDLIWPDRLKNIHLVLHSTGERSTNFLTAKEDPVDVIPMIEKVINNLPCSCSDLTRVWLVSWLFETNQYPIHKKCIVCQEHGRLPAMVPTDAVC